MEPTWKAFDDYLVSEFPHLREAIQSESLDWSPYPHYFLEVYLLRELVDAARAKNASGVAHASRVLEAVLGSPEQDLVEAALHSVLEPIADSADYDLLRPYLGDVASNLVNTLRAARA